VRADTTIIRGSSPSGILYYRDVARAQRWIDATPRPAAFPRATGELVGRDAELARIAGVLDDALLFLLLWVMGFGF
jgi:hypothetical protein